jgi:hypothetical protein
MILFLKKLFFFLILCLLVLLIPCAYVFHLGFRTGEFYPLDQMIKIQQKNDVLVLLGTQYIDPHLKYKNANTANWDILVLGTSRMHQIREDFFIDGITFYNTATAVHNLNHYIKFIEALEVFPRFLVFNLDPWQFNKNYLETDWAKMVDEIVSDYKSSYKYDPLKQFQAMLLMLKDGSLKFPQKFNNLQNIGFTAAVYGEGWRKDGSYYWKRALDMDRYKNATAYMECIPSIDKGYWLFVHDPEDGQLYEDSIKLVEKILSLCKERNIMVVAFLPPFTPSIYNRLMENGHYTYMTQVYPALLPLFQEYGYELYDFTASDMVDDSMTFDGWHPDERGAYNILLSIKERNSALADYIRIR